MINIADEATRWIIGIVGAGGVAWGTVKYKLYNKIGYREHGEICSKATTPIMDKINTIETRQADIIGMIKEIHGYLKAQNGGSL